MSFRKYIIIIIFLSVGFKANAQQDTILTLQQCLDIAVKTNLTVKQDSLNAETARINLVQAKDNLFPSISGNASRNFSTGRVISSQTNGYVNQSLTSDSYSLQGNVPLFSGLAYQSAIKQARLAYEAGKMDYQAAKDVVIVNIVTNYLLVLDAEEILGQSKSQLVVAREQVDRSQVLEDQGANKAASDLYDLKGSLAGSQVALVDAQNSLNSAMLSLYQLMNIPYNKNAKLQPLNAEDLEKQYSVGPDQVYETALQQLAMVKAAALHTQSAEKGVKYYKGLLFPTLDLSGGIATNYANSDPKSYSDQFKNNYGTYVQVGLSIPVFTNHIRKNNIALAKINLQNYQFIEQNTKVQLKQNIEQAYYNMLSAYNKYQALDEQVKVYTESFRIYKIRYEAGVLTSVDYITAKDKVDAANLNLISARYNYFIYSKILDYYQGKLSF